IHGCLSKQEFERWVRARDVSGCSGTRCEYIPVRSPSPSMAQDGPEKAGHNPSLNVLCQFRLASGTEPGAMWCMSLSRDRVRQGCRTRAYRDVFTACPVTRTCTTWPQQGYNREEGCFVKAPSLPQALRQHGRAL